MVLKLKLTRKKTLHATERETERVQQLRVQYWHEISQVKLEDLIFVDETGSNERDDTALCSFLRPAAVPITTLGCGRGQNLTIIGAMALRGLVGEKTIPGASDALAFITYVTQILVPNLWVGACVVIRNFA